MNCQVLLVVLFLQYITKCDGGYYWRDYENKIPFDAYSAGESSENKKVYIGQSLVNEDNAQGLYPTRIIEGKDIWIARAGARRANDLVQILCSDDPTRFNWITTNSRNLYLLKADYKIVRGGFEYTGGEVAIGRIQLRQDTIIGKIMSDNKFADMWYVLDGQENRAGSYEVLAYKPKNHIMGNGTILNNFN